MTKWYAIMEDGTFVFLGEVEASDTAYDLCPSNTVWVLSEAEARNLFKSMSEVLA